MPGGAGGAGNPEGAAAVKIKNRPIKSCSIRSLGYVTGTGMLGPMGTPNIDFACQSEKCETGRIVTTPSTTHSTVSMLGIIALSLTGCNATMPAVPTEVRIPVPTPCIAQADIPQTTFATDAELAALPDGPFVLRLARDRLERAGHIAALEAVLSGCVGEKPVPAGVAPMEAPVAKPWFQFWK